MQQKTVQIDNGPAGSVEKDPQVIPLGYYKVNGKLMPYLSTSRDAVRVLLQTVGEDPDREGLKDTPDRVVRALEEMTAGYRMRPEDILSKTFGEDYDEMILLRGIHFTSLCEHHLLPFAGTAYVGYLPGKVVGLSKLARLVDCFSRRLQMQERITKQIAESLERYLQAKGVGVVLRSSHCCMTCRGVLKGGAEMVTSVMLGVMREDRQARAEFLSLCGLDR